MVEIKTAEEIARMRKASAVVAKALKAVSAAVKPGVTTAALDAIAVGEIKAAGAVPAFLGYRGYPATLCASINEEVVHGIPSNTRVLKDGDIISLDVGAVCDGFYGDAAVTVPVGNVDQKSRRLIEITEKSLDRALSVIRPGVRLGDMSSAVEEFVKAAGMSVVREFTGHGIGRHLHEEPSIPNFGRPGTGIRLEAGMTLAIEPMVCLGGPDVIIQGDGWTAVTADGARSAHFEHTVCVTNDGCEVLSRL